MEATILKVAKARTSDTIQNKKIKVKDMILSQETGHYANVVNFKALISFCEQHHSVYNPSRASIKLPGLKTLLAEAEKITDSLRTTKAVYDETVQNRELVFRPLRTLATRLVNMMAACGCSDHSLIKARFYHSKIHGKRIRSIKRFTVAKPENDIVSDGMKLSRLETAQGNSNAQVSYLMLMQHFLGLIHLLEMEENYKPNEVDLKTVTLRRIYKEMEELNIAARAALVRLSDERNKRDVILYAEGRSVLSSVANIKKYLKSLFGSNSPEYRQVSKLRFRPKKIHSSGGLDTLEIPKEIQEEKIYTETVTV